MQTDQLFQEYFQVAPGAFFELLQIEPPCDYHFTSPVFKTSERCMDGFLAPVEADKPYYFIDASQHSVLVNLLVKFIMQKFVELPYKELERMLKLTPLEQTHAGRELMELGEVKGRAEGHREGLYNAIRIVLLTRFPHTSQEVITHLVAILGYVQDVETLEMLLQLATQTDSFEDFEQKVLEAAAKSALQPPVNGKASTKEETE